MGFAFLDQYWFEENRALKACPKCKSKRGAIIVQFSLNVNQPQKLRSPICPRCDRRECERQYPPIYWGEKLRSKK